MAYLRALFTTYALTLIQLICATTPDIQEILAQLRKNGACCTGLNYFLPGKVHFNNITDPAYQTSQQSFWSEQERSLRPTCIVIPASTQDVLTAVTILNVGFQASIQGCKFALRGAGHTPQAGAANIDGGITIDMQSMNQVTVSSDQKSVTIGPGNRWGNVYSTLDHLNLAMVGGRVTPVGVGGLMTGSGISFFSGRYGFACDNINTFEVVLANGTIVNTDSTRNPTLFRALKGGSSNFGIITSMTSKLFSQAPFWGGTIAQPITNKDAVFDFFSNFSSSAKFDPYSALIADIALIASVPIIVHNLAYTNGDAAWPPPAFAELDAMPKIATTVRKDKLSSFTTELATALAITNGHNNLFLTLTFTNQPTKTPEFMSEVYNLANAAAQELISVVGIVFTLSFQPLPHVLYSKSATSNALGLDRFQDDLINLLLTLSWQLALDNPLVYARMQKLEDDIADLAKENGLYNAFIYLNYAAQWQDPIKGYGDESVQFLRGVSRRYDAGGLFQKGMPGGFKLGI